MIGMCFQYDTDDIYSAYLQISSLSIYFGVAIYCDLSWFSQMLIHTESLVFFPGFFALSQISIYIYRGFSALYIYRGFFALSQISIYIYMFSFFLFGGRVGNQKWYALHMHGLAGCSRQDVMQRAFQCQKWSSSNVPVGLIIVIWNKAWTNGLTTHQTIWCLSLCPVSVGHDHFHLPSIDRIDLARAAAQVLMFHPGTCRIPRSLELPNIWLQDILILRYLKSAVRCNLFSLLGSFCTSLLISSKMIRDSLRAQWNHSKTS